MTSFIIKRISKSKGKPLKVILGKGVAKKAVERNLLKRRVRAAMRPVVGKSGAGFVIIVKPGAADLTYKELQKELVRKTRT